MTWTNKIWKFNTTPDDTQMDALQADITAKANGDTGAPDNVLASMASNSVDTSQLVAASINQSKIPTALSEGSGPFSFNFASAGGEYGFYPQNRVSSSGVLRGAQITNPGTGISTTSYLTNMNVINISGTGTGYIRQRYIQASPPYDLGNGECYLFTFILRDKLTKEIIAVWSAPDAPWHNNGPTNIAAYSTEKILKGFREDESAYDYTDLKTRSDNVYKRISNGQTISNAGRLAIQQWMVISLTLPIVGDRNVLQSVKQKDMPVIPHPFGDVLSTQEILLLDPISDTTRELAELQQSEEESMCMLIHNGLFVISDKELARVSPPGVKTVSYRWK